MRGIGRVRGWCGCSLGGMLVLIVVVGAWEVVVVVVVAVVEGWEGGW